MFFFSFFFSLAHLIHYTDMKLYILQYKRKMGREKAFILHKEVG